MVGVQQPRGRRDDAVAVGVRVVGEGDVEAVAHLGQPRHRVRRRAVHPDLAVPVERHEAERRVELLVDDLEVEPVHLGDRHPVGGARTAERVDAEAQPGLADRVEVDHLREVGHVRVHVVALVQGVGPLGVAVGDAEHALELRVEQLVRLVLDPAGGVGVGRPAVRRVVLEAAVAGRVVRGRDHDAVGTPSPAFAVVVQDRVRDHRRRGGAAVGVDADVDAVGDQHLDDRLDRRRRQRMRVGAEEQRPVDPLLLPVAAHRLADGCHVPLGERAGQRGPPVAGGAEGDAVRRVRAVVVGREQRVDVDQVGLVRERAGAGIDAAHLARLCHWSKATAMRISAPMMIWR